jgi:hypothetical protein
MNKNYKRKAKVLLPSPKRENKKSKEVTLLDGLIMLIGFILFYAFVFYI